MRKLSCVRRARQRPSRLQHRQSQALRVSAYASAATEIITIATAMTIAAPALNFTNMTAGCIAAGTTEMATEW